ncbi:hypothetical protein PG989_001732 [Apiospora arundinis]|uniref:Peptidase C14 caspase domain-containing protein n=1 Tax=Apiospora arundinis TaxID=335852 RepID=A0ABR2HM29_9PEZI
MAPPGGNRVSTASTHLQIPELHNSPTKDYQDEHATHDSKLKALWDIEMGDLKSQYIPYTKVSVLLLSWHKDIDDLKTDEEVTDLENLFKDKFMFETTRQILTKDSKSAQAQVNHYLAKFVYENDSSNTMLIIYYAGHGRPGNRRGNLRLAASTSRPEANGDLHEIVWDSAENNIKETRADVLVIFDCCHAGELERNIRGHYQNRAFEYLAATSAKSTTRKPGPKSFTRALIWSLDHLLEKHTRFSTQELLRTIHNDAPHFPKKQCPRLSEGQPPTQRKIMIAPLTNEAKTRAVEASQKDDEDDVGEERGQDFLLRFVFDGDITTPMLQSIASHLKDLIQQGEIKAKAVVWEGFNTVNYRDAVIAQPWLRYFSNSLSRIRRRGERFPAVGEPRLLLSGSEAASSPASDMFVVTPEPMRSTEVEIGEDQGVSAEKPMPRGDVGSSYTALRPTRASIGKAGHEEAPRRRSKRRQGSDNEDANVPVTVSKRARVARKD